MTKIIRTPMHRYFLLLMTWHLTRAFYELFSCSNYLYQKHDYTGPDQKDFKTYLCLSQSAYLYIMIQFQANSVSYLPLKTLSHTKTVLVKSPSCKSRAFWFLLIYAATQNTKNLFTTNMEHIIEGRGCSIFCNRYFTPLNVPHYFQKLVHQKHKKRKLFKLCNDKTMLR